MTRSLETILIVHEDEALRTHVCRVLRAEGYTTIAVNYTLGPEGAYPTAVNQLNQALAYIDEHADELNVDASQIVLAGDSAGAQLASQMATIMTSPDYAEIMSIAPALQADQIIATVMTPLRI